MYGLVIDFVICFPVILCLFSSFFFYQKNLIVNLVRIQNDGTVEVDLTQNPHVASELLELRLIEFPPGNNDFIPTEMNKSVPKLRIAMLVVGTRGDVQPFLAVAKRLQVRLT